MKDCGAKMKDRSVFMFFLTSLIYVHVFISIFDANNITLIAIINGAYASYIRRGRSKKEMQRKRVEKR